MTYPLFSSSDKAYLTENLARYFEGWLAYRRSSGTKSRSQRPLNPDSAEVYQEMWNAFASFCVDRGVDLHEVEPDDLLSFLDTRSARGTASGCFAKSGGTKLSLRYARRFLTLIDWVSAFQAKADGQAPNPAARTLLEKPEYKYANASHKDPLPDFLTEAQAKVVIAFVTGTPDTDNGRIAEKWKALRNRTAVALMLGGGLTPGDVRHLKLSGVHMQADLPWKLSLPGNGNFPARETPLAEWARLQLASWLAIRQSEGLGGDFVFPSSRAGRQWSDSRCYEASRDVLEQAGLARLDGGVFRLRHTFALRQLAQGHEEADVARWLGLLDVNGMARYRRVLDRPVNVA